MTDAERKLLIWCGIILVRGAPLTPAEADEIDQLIANVRSPLPKIEWDTPVLGRIVETEQTQMIFDYRKLLVAYMSHVIGRESSSQIEFSCPFATGLDALSKDEMAELRRIEIEATETYLEVPDGQRC